MKRKVLMSSVVASGGGGGGGCISNKLATTESCNIMIMMIVWIEGGRRGKG